MSKKPNKTPKPEQDEKPDQPEGETNPSPSYLDHPSVDTSGRFAVDRLIRSLGFFIRSRPKKGEVTWTGPDKKVYTHSAVLAKLRKNNSSNSMLEDAKYAEELYLHLKYPETDEEIANDFEASLKEESLKKDLEELDKKAGKKRKK